MGDDQVLELFQRLEQGLQRLEQRQERLEQGQERLEQGQAEHRRETQDFRTVAMTKFERVEDRLQGLSDGLGLNVAHVGGILDQLTARESQLGLLQDAIRAGINAESVQVRTVQKTLAGLNSMVLVLQSQVADLTQRMDEIQHPMHGPT